MKRVFTLFLIFGILITNAATARASSDYIIELDGSEYSTGMYIIVSVSPPSDEWYTIEIMKGDTVLVSFMERREISLPILIPASWEAGTDYAFRVGRGTAIASVGFAVRSDETERPQVAPVTAVPAASAVDAGTRVTLATDTPGAVIYYTMDGATPTEASARYTDSGIIINADLTLTAFAVKEGYADSDILTQVYTLKADENNNDNGNKGDDGDNNYGGGGGGKPAEPIAEPPTEPPAPAFTDTAGHWAEAGITAVVARGLFKGVSDSAFDPGGTMTRSMFATVLARLDGVDLAAWNADGTFADVPAGAWFADAVEWAASIGIVSGVGEGNFAPERAVTREQMAVMLYNYIKRMEYVFPTEDNLQDFSDAGAISPWASDAVAFMHATGLLTGKDGGRFDPQATASRAEVATIFARVLERLA